MSPEFFTTVATSPSQRRMVHRLREEAFARADAQPTVTDAYDDAPNCRSFILRSAGRGRAIGSIRACVYSGSFAWRPIPAFDLYGEEIESRADLRSGMVQATHFCIAPTSRGSPLLPKLLLFREILKTAVRERSGHVICIIKNQSAHLRFHGRMGFTQIGPEKIHPLADQKAVLIGVPTSTFLATVRADKVFQAIGDFGNDNEFEQEQIGGTAWRLTM
jgi:hypothetical protein